MIQNDGLISGAKVLRGGRGNTARTTFLSSAKLEMKGLAYLEENTILAKTYRGLKEIKSWLSI